MFPGVGEGVMGRLSLKVHLHLLKLDGIQFLQLPFPEKFRLLQLPKPGSDIVITN